MSDDEDELSRLRAQRAARLIGVQGNLDDDDDIAPNSAFEQLRAHLPVSFGGNRAAVSEEKPAPTAKQFGPPRPPKFSILAPTIIPTAEHHTGTEQASLQPTQLATHQQTQHHSQQTQPHQLHNTAHQQQQQQPPQTKPVVGPPRPPQHGPPVPPLVDGTKSQAFGPPKPPHQSQGTAAVGPPKPTHHLRSLSAEADEQDEFVGPAPPPQDENSDSEAGDTDDDDVDQRDPYLLPISQEAVMGSAHARAVTTIDIDRAGARFITGSMDYTLRMYDFGGMKSDLKAFREIEPTEGHPVLSLSWSPTGDSFLCVTGAAQAKIYDRNCHSLGEFTRGDMYIRDMKNTKGHISALCCGQWHPVDRWTVMTCSDDGTVRIWDTNNIMQKTVIKPNLAKPVRTSVTTCQYSSDGNLIAAGLNDGTIQLWNVTGKFGSSAAVGAVQPPTAQMIDKQNWTYVSRSNQLVRGAHEAGNEMTSLAFSQDSQTLASRSVDGTVKLWDLRKFTKPVRVWSDLPCSYATTKVIFSPDERLLVTGTSSGAQDEGGAVVFLDQASGEMVRKVGMPGSVSALAWHERLNQIFVGIGNRRSGGCRVLYDPSLSQRGVIAAAGRQPRKPSPFDFQPPMLIKNPHALPLFREGPPRKRPRDHEIEERKMKHIPDPGRAAGKGSQGRLGAPASTLLTQHLLKQGGKLKPVDQEEDPREAILRHGDKAHKEFAHLTAAYAKTQPQPVYAEEDEEEED